MQPGTYCTHCGSELLGRSRYCTTCGAERERPPVSPRATEGAGSNVLLRPAEIEKRNAEETQTLKEEQTQVESSRPGDDRPDSSPAEPEPGQRSPPQATTGQVDSGPQMAAPVEIVPLEPPPVHPEALPLETLVQVTEPDMPDALELQNSSSDGLSAGQNPLALEEPTLQSELPPDAGGTPDVATQTVIVDPPVEEKSESLLNAMARPLPKPELELRGLAARSLARPLAPYKHAWYRPGIAAWLIILVFTGAAYALVLGAADPHKPLVYWGTMRGAGFAVYELLSLAVVMGIFLSWRLKPFTGAWLVIERMHPLVMLAAAVAASVHIVGLLMLEFPPVEALVPFASKFHTVPLSLGIISVYIAVVALLSTYAIGVIGFRVWRGLHDLGFVAWGLALAHGLATGHDSSQHWAIALYAGGAALVAFFLLVLIVRVITGRRAGPAAALVT